MLAPPQAEKQVICWSCTPMPMCWLWMWMRHAASGFIRICSAWACKPRCLRRTPDNLRNGGMGKRLTPSCWTHPAQHPALCEGTRMCAGCAGPQTAGNWPKHKRRCSRRFGLCSCLVGACFIAPVLSSRPRVMRPSRRFFKATPMPYCTPRRDI